MRGIFFFKEKRDYKAVKLPLPAPSPMSAGNPFFYISRDDDNTVDLFLKALSQQKTEDALAYLSKNFAEDFDLKELSGFFGSAHYKSLAKIEFDPSPKNCRTNSILVMNQESKRNVIVHLHLIKEPDKYSNWKIYGIERE